MYNYSSKRNYYLIIIPIMILIRKIIPHKMIGKYRLLIRKCIRLEWHNVCIRRSFNCRKERAIIDWSVCFCPSVTWLSAVSISVYGIQINRSSHQYSASRSKQISGHIQHALVCSVPCQLFARPKRAVWFIDAIR